MIHLEYLSTTRISGPDAGVFLQSQLSADIGALDSGEATFAAYCNPKGQVLGLLLVGRAGDEFLLAAASDLLPGIVQRLKIYQMRSRVTWGEPGEFQVMGLQAMEKAPLDGFGFATAVPVLNYALVSGVGSASEQAESWKSLELQQGVAWLDSITTEKFIPQMLGQDAIGALSFSKGCYPGQEIVARARYLGKVKRKPLIVTVDGTHRFDSASKLEIEFPQESVSGTLIDSAITETGHTVLFLVTSRPEGQEPVSLSCDGEVFNLAGTGAW